ncbi:MAG: class I SAM-dependent rRNA methyltransferase [Chlamydiota bacterium]
MKLELKPGKERPIRQHHHWIFSGAVAGSPSFSDGDLADVYSSSKEKLGIAVLNKGRSIVGHMLAFGEELLSDAILKRIREAAALRRRWFNPKETNAYRIINAEGDGLPGLVVDAYGDTLVMQISNPGIERLKGEITAALIQELSPKTLYEKSTSFLRKKGGMDEAKSLLYGEAQEEVEILEKGLRYSVDVIHGQKTGLFLDQREMRSLVRELAPNRRILNCFAYTGGFSVSALAGGALHVDSVEISPKCKSKVEKNLLLNGLALDKHHFEQADVFDYLKTSSWNYDLVILDPPAFVKKREDIDQAFRAYKCHYCGQFHLSQLSRQIAPCASSGAIAKQSIIPFPYSILKALI